MAGHARTPIPPPPPADAQWFTRVELAGYWRLHESAIYRLQKDPKFPLPKLFGNGTLRWAKAKVDAYAESMPEGWSTVGGKRQKKSAAEAEQKDGQEEEASHVTR